MELSLATNTSLQGDIAYSDKDYLSEYKVDLFNKNLSFGENHISVANTGFKILQIFFEWSEMRTVDER